MESGPYASLSLVRGWVGEKGAEAIASASFGSSLTHLDLSQNEDLRDAGLRALLRSTSLTALRWLKLEYCGIRDAMVDELLESPLIQKLEHLDLSMNLSGGANKRIRERLGDRYKA